MNFPLVEGKGGVWGGIRYVFGIGKEEDDELSKCLDK